jgi:hypothetical protein
LKISELLSAVAAINFWNCKQKHCILLSRAAKKFGMTTVILQPWSEKFWNCEQALYFVQPRSESFGIDQQKQLKLKSPIHRGGFRSLTIPMLGQKVLGTKNALLGEFSRALA